MTDPEDAFGKFANATVSRLTGIVPEAGTIVLCGEPGIGKTTELEGILPRLEARNIGIQGNSLSIRFREVGDMAEFRRHTIGSKTWEEWRAGTGRLTLLVDGIDEGLLRIPNFINELTGLLREEPVARLRLVLACRTAEWPLEMGRGLFALWPTLTKDPLYELCPLRRKDAVEAARAYECDPTGFLRAVWDRNVVVLASRPVTLFFLLKEFKQHGGLPTTHRELYQRGTANLVREVDAMRLELLRALRKTQTRVTDAERLRAAQRLAAMLLLGGRSAIRTPSGAFSVENPNDLSLVAAAGDESSFITMAALEEAVESALFTSLGEHRFGFAHQTFAECLAAQHLRDLPLVQLRRLLCQRDSRGEHVIPQLAELAGWVAGENAAFCEHLLRMEPEVLLRSDVTRLEGALKARLVESILTGASQEKIFDDIGFRRFLGGLGHTGLAAQLGPLISDPQAHCIARRIAMSIAERCSCVDLIDPLLKVAMDETKVAHLRDRAASALDDIVPDDQLAILEPLGRGEAKPDADDTIKGCALQRLVPKHWKVRDALPYLTPRKNDHFMGAYDIFLRRHLPKALEKDDLVPVLAWIRSQQNCLDSLACFHDLASASFAKALMFLHVPAIAGEAVATWQLWVTRHDIYHLPNDSEIRTVLAENEGVRLQFVASVLNAPGINQDHIFGLTHPLPLIAGAASLDWLLDQIQTAPVDRRANWATAIAYLTSRSEIASQCWDKLLSRISEVPELAAQFEWLRAWNLDEKLAQDSKSWWLREKERREENLRHMRQFTPEDPKPAIQSAFSRFSQGDWQAWVVLWYQLIRGKSGREEHAFTCNLSNCPNWELLSAKERDIVPRIARSFLLSDAKHANHLDKNNDLHLAAATAIWILRDTANNDDELRNALIDFWIGVMVWDVDSESEYRRVLFKLAYTLAPGAARNELAREARDDAARFRRPFAFRLARDCWDPTVSMTAIQIIESSTDSEYVLNALDELIGSDRGAVCDYAAGLINSVAPGSPAYPIHLRGALVGGLLADAAVIWPVAYPLLRSDDDLARAVLTKVCYIDDLEQRGNLKNLPETSLGDLYLTLRRLFPSPVGRSRKRAGFVSARDCTDQVRGQIPGAIAARGTEAACRELLRLAAALPEEATWLRWSHREALTNLRRNLWQPPTSEHIKSLLDRPRTRMLTCDDDLSDLILESLGRLQMKLTGQALPSAEELWVWDGAGLNRKDFRPKDEEALSDYVARWLVEDIGPTAGVVVNREVQPRRGARTDVIVQETIPGQEAAFGKLTVVIEVKGCWHQDVQSGLRTQLVDGYLRAHGWRCGIYLVGWFVCPQWKNARNRLQSDTVAEAGIELAAMAADFGGIASDVRIEPFLLDCTLPSPKPPSSP